MDIEKLVKKLSESPEFHDLIIAEMEISDQIDAGMLSEIGRPIKRARLMEPEIAEGEWLLNSAESNKKLGED